MAGNSAHEKLLRLREILGGMGSILVAYSGGVDSTFLLSVAHEELGDDVLAVTATSETYPQEEQNEAVDVARRMGARHLVLETSELDNEEFLANPPNRCYFCKVELWEKLGKVASQHGLKYIVDGFNVDDIADFRPGAQAGRERGIRSPLREAGLSKDEIRRLSKERGLPTWDKPAMACLASRLPYGQTINKEKLVQIGAAEKSLREMGFRKLRVRHHGTVARIEVAPEEMALLLQNGAEVSRKLKELGFLYVTMDLEGYRTGSMNEALKPEEKTLLQPTLT